jgi:hypothetical protein
VLHRLHSVGTPFRCRPQPPACVSDGSEFSEVVAAAGGLGIERHVGGVLESALKLVVKEPTLDNPTAEQISAADRSAQRSNAAARSRRGLIR